MQLVVVGVYSITSLMLVLEAVVAWRLKATERDEAAATSNASPLPSCTAIVAAYLPNEQKIILETVRHMLTQVDVPADQFQVILAYNTPEPLAIEVELREIAELDYRFLLLPVLESRSKAENVNAALEKATGKVIAIYDADHLPASDCFQRAWRRISNGADMVQGRCMIRNHAQNWLTRIVTIEFDTIYAVSHPGRAAFSGTAIFGGSNGYWRRETLMCLKLNPAMLTEDIDVSVRALLSGCRLVHDRELISTELSPLQLGHWAIQRKRWAQGWLEVAIAHTATLMRSPHLTGRQKAIWFYLMPWREIYPALAIQFFPIILASLVIGAKIHWASSPILVAATIFNWGCGPFILLTTYACTPPRTRSGLGIQYWVYGLFSLAYTTLKIMVTLAAQVSHLLCDREWVTTPRSYSRESLLVPTRTRDGRIPHRALSHLLTGVAVFLLIWNGLAMLQYKKQASHSSLIVAPGSFRGKAFYNAKMLTFGGSDYVGIYHGGGANNVDQFAGSVLPWNGYGWQASLWNGSTRHELSALPGAVQSMACAVNQQGDAVGEAGDDYGQGQAVLWKAGNVRALGQLKGYCYSVATGLNDKDQIVGRAYPSVDAAAIWWARPAHAFLWENEKIYDLGVPPGCTASRANAINNVGQVVGWALTRTLGRHAFFWERGIMHDLGTLPGGRFSTAIAINDRGQIAGDSDDALGRHHTILWENGRLRDLGSPPGCEWCHPVAMNALGQIVGDAGGESHVGNGRVFVWDNINGMRYVALSQEADFHLQRVLDIRNNGDILALGVHYTQPDPYDHCLFLLKSMEKWNP